MKKVLSILLAIICVISFTVTAFAEDTVIPSESVVTNEDVEGTEAQEDPENPEEPAEPDEPVEPAKTFDVTMYICATANSLTGHVWLYFVNNSNVPVKVGYVDLTPGAGISVGSLRNSRKDGGGTYYNGEAMMAEKDGKLESLKDHTYSLKMSLTKEQLETVNEKIKSKNAYEMIFYNCGVFATSVWNSVSDKKVVHIVLPIFTILNMTILGAKKGELLMQNPTESEIFKQTDSGCRIADEKSFNMSCVNF